MESYQGVFQFCDTSIQHETTPTMTEYPEQPTEENPEQPQMGSMMTEDPDPPANQATEDEPEGFLVEEEWHCIESGGEVVVNADGEMICYT